MAYFRTILKGSIATVESWSSGINWGVFGLSPDVPSQQTVDAILAQLITATTVANVPASVKTVLSNAVTIDGWRVEMRAEDETVLSVAEGLLTTAVNGNSGATKTPQDAVVVSLRTNTPGPRGRGRMYLPAVGTTLSALFQMSQPTPAALVEDMKTWLNAIGTAVNAGIAAAGGAQTVVLSVRSVTDHVCRDVVSLQVGSVLDTQRRRRDNLPETYSSVSYP